MCYGMFTQDLDLRWHVYDGMFMQLRAACVRTLTCVGMFMMACLCSCVLPVSGP